MIHPLPSVCDACGLPLVAEGATLTEERRQVFDLPEAPVQVTEHRVQAQVCRCGKVHRSSFPKEVVSAAAYGPVVRSRAIYLTQAQLLPVARAAQILSDCYGLALSPGTIQAWIFEAGATLAPVAAQISEGVIQAEVGHFDESGLRVGKQLHWLHSASTAILTWYGHHRNRGAEAMRALGKQNQKILPNISLALSGHTPIIRFSG